LILLCYLKHYETIDRIKDTFSVSNTHLHDIIDTVSESVTPVLYERYVTNIKELTADESEEEDPIFPDAKCVMDATFQPIWTPTGHFNESKVYFSGKHKMYGLKSQCIHDRKGRVVHCVPGIPGSVHDLTVCRNHIDEVCMQVRSRRRTLMPLVERYPDQRRWQWIMAGTGGLWLSRPSTFS
jgi:hypothetical protein